MPTIMRSPNEQFNALGRDTLDLMREMESSGDIAGLRELMAEDYPILAANLDLQGDFSDTQKHLMQEIAGGIHAHSLEVDPVPPIPPSRERQEEAAPQVMQGTLGIPVPDTTSTRGGNGSSFPR